MAGIADYDATAGNNTAVGGISVAEGMAPGQVNNAIRAMMADLAAFYSVAYYRGSALGTVSESSGVPTGALMEAGSNANGYYGRDASGWQVFYKGGATFAYLEQNVLAHAWTFPASSVIPPAVCAYFSSASADYTGTASLDIGPIRGASGTTGQTVSALRINGAREFQPGDVAENVRLFAISRWF